MATVGAALTSEKNTSRLSYITVAAFNAAFFTYTQTTSNYVTTGTLTAVVNPATGVAVTSGDCPAGRVLRETGRKLYATAAYPGVSTYMVSVYDSVLGVNGFIDPNSTLFALYNVDKSNTVDAASTEQTSYGPPVYTGSTVTAARQIRSTTVTVLPAPADSTPLNIDPTLGQVFKLAQGSGVATTLACTPAPAAGSLVYVIITQAGTAAAVTGGTGIKMASVTPTQNRVTTIAFVSDGINLNQFGSATSATAP